MKNFIFSVTAAASIAIASAAQAPPSPAHPGSSPPAPSQSGGRWRGAVLGFPGGGGGVLGSVTEVTPEHYTVKADTGDLYTVHYSVNTRIMKLPPRPERGSGKRPDRDPDAPRPEPQPLKPNEIKVGDIITANGELDAQAKSLGAVFIALVDPESARQMRAMQANYGKTWLAGRVTAIDLAALSITIEGMDRSTRTVTVDENTSFHDRRDSITLADIHPGENLRAEGSVKDGAFLATQVSAVEPRDPGGYRTTAKPFAADPQ